MHRSCIKGLVIAATLLSTTGASSALAEEAQSPWSGSVSVSLFSDYMFRGLNFYDGTSIQPSFGANYDTGYGTVSGNVWMHASGEDGSEGADKFFETDYTLAYQMTLDPVTIKVGHLWYTYPDHSDDIDDTAEFFGTVVIDDSEWNPLLSLTPTVSVYHDYDVIDGQYYELGLSHAFTSEVLGEGFNVTPFVSMGWASDSTEVYADDGFVQVTYGASSNMNLGDIGVTPLVAYTQAEDDNGSNEFWFGTTFSYGF